MQTANQCLYVALRVEWVKAKARADRWSKQVRLVDEEMRRVLASTRHRASWWNLLRSKRQTQPSTNAAVDEELDEGLKAYADRHSAMETALAAAFEQQWGVVRDKAKLCLNKSMAIDDTTSGDTGVNIVRVEINLEDEEEAAEDDS